MTFDELKNLDWRDPGRWPLPVRLGAIGIWFLAAFLVVGYFFVWQAQQPELDRYQLDELKLRNEFREKHGKAVNLELYKQQLADIERSFGAMLRQLPGKTEVPNLLVDISQTGLAAGLQQQLFQPLNQQNRDFYAELPIKIRITGTYHDMGAFASDVAQLPRIVTLNDVSVNNDKGVLTMDAVAKTFRYLDEDEVAKQRKAAKDAKDKKDKANR